MDRFDRFFGGVYEQERGDDLAVVPLRPVKSTLDQWRTRAAQSFRHGFMRFWYSYVQVLNRLLPVVTVQGKRLVIFPEVYKPLENEHVCRDYCREGDRVLDLGCGSGVVTVFCAPSAREVVAVDISLPAVRNTEENCRRQGLDNVIVRQSDMFAAVDGRFDLIVANCPYIEDEFAAEEQQFATSVRYMPTLFAQVDAHLGERGRLLIQSPLKARARVERFASKHGLALVGVRRLPPKSPRLALLSLLYMQIGFRSAFFELRRASDPR